ncbi:MAG: exodeoxyribonuclease VII large subunit [Phycisphaerales bacterium]|nr:exodeoxyribonuclease VII large subunit [Phycisphaerales bacterium]
MGRLPFDPNKMRAKTTPGAPATPAPKPAEAPLTVSRLASLIQAALEHHLPARIRVTGEISGARRSTHLYFSLKDAEALVGAVLFASNLRKLAIEPKDGQQVIATGRIEFYPPQGRLTLIVESLEPAGQGAHDLRFRQLCEELRQLGWFDPARKRPIPTFPRRVAVVTSRTGAALQDVLATMAKRCPAVDVAVLPVLVQGEAAARQVAAAIRFLSKHHSTLGIDALIVTRGGGSPEDLAAFNDRDLAEAILNCPIPVVAAIGHETDTTIAELVADERCATPTQAAVRLTPDRAALNRQLDALASRCKTHLARALRFERQRLATAARHPVLADPHGATRLATDRVHRVRAQLASAAASALQTRYRRLDATSLRHERQNPRELLTAARAAHDSQRRRLDTALRHLSASRAAAVESLARRLDSVGPAAVLRRGYSCTRRADGTILRAADQVAPGDRVTTLLASGAFDSLVASTAPGPHPGLSPVAPPAPSPRRKPKPNAPRPVPPDQLDLFRAGG